MKKYFFALAVLFLAIMACQLGNTPSAPQPYTQSAITEIVITQIASQPESAELFIQTDGRSSLDIASELLPYLQRLGWYELGVMESGVIVGAPDGLGLRENGLAYHISFATNYGRALALVAVEMYFVPERVGTPFDETYMFSGINRDAPGLSVYQDVEGNHQTTFRGAYPFNTKLNITEFSAYLNFYAATLDKLLAEYPFFSKQ